MLIHESVWGVMRRDANRAHEAYLRHDLVEMEGTGGRVGCAVRTNGPGSGLGIHSHVGPHERAPGGVTAAVRRHTQPGIATAFRESFSERVKGPATGSVSSRMEPERSGETSCTATPGPARKGFSTHQARTCTARSGQATAHPGFGREGNQGLTRC